MPNEPGNDQQPKNKHPVRTYWLTAGLATVLAAIIGVSVALISNGHTNSGGAGTNSANQAGQVSGVPSSYQGTWQGAIGYPGYDSFQVTLQLGPGSSGNQVGQYSNSTTGCVWTVYLVHGGTPLLVHMVVTTPGPNCVSSFEANVALQSQNSVSWAIIADPNTGVVPRSGILTSQ
jgi:hypothetical protein